ncbi:uroporphyrinogen-III C-methyltransferase [Deinococcus sp. Marseille-Q6407]|uniref:uroporphyrinogen-III C-methyltransferase n=1 Tax=Deinococcus sp. Marseille-Q6407 TaxID=2969223 RepID=UPI0021C0CAE4|nr:uroporphyrinogen-III C-methyltransferase [Deinococcus sp. Marseille-Q6407]
MSEPFVSLVGAGPGDPGLLTLRARTRLEQADVVLVDALVSPALLALCPQAETVEVGKRGFQQSWSQDDINALLVSKARQGGGQRVVRLKGGDPFVFGRGSEEALACQAAGVPFEIVPGVSSALAAAAYAGIPVTHRGAGRSFAVLTGTDRHGPASYAELGGVDTLVFLMGLRHLQQITGDLIAAGRSPQTPAACIQWASTPQQRTVLGTLADLPERVRAAGLSAPAVTVVGEPAALHRRLDWFHPDEAGTRSLPLQGARVAVTRTRVQAASELAALLRAQGAQVSEIPLLNFQPASSPRTVVGALSGFSGWLLFSSEYAVRALVQTLLAAGRDLRLLAGAQLAAVGSGTAQALREFGLAPNLVPTRSGSRFLAAELPAEPGETVLHATSQHADPVLEQGLAERGLDYLPLETYRTAPARLTAAQQAQLQEAQVVTLASAAGVRALAQVAGTNFTAAVIGPQTEQAARAAGFSRLVLAEQPTLESLTNAVVRALQEAALAQPVLAAGAGCL